MSPTPRNFDETGDKTGVADDTRAVDNAGVRDDIEVGPCRYCGRLVAAASVRCRSCGYDPDPVRNEQDRFVWGVAGLFLTLTIVGAPLGLLFLWKALAHHRATSGRVVALEARPESFIARVTGNLRQTVGSVFGQRGGDH